MGDAGLLPPASSSLLCTVRVEVKMPSHWSALRRKTWDKPVWPASSPFPQWTYGFKMVRTRCVLVCTVDIRFKRLKKLKPCLISHSYSSNLTQVKTKKRKPSPRLWNQMKCSVCVPKHLMLSRAQIILLL